MKNDIILCGVGGQGILSIATVLGEAATQAGLYLKQSEVHGMSQRGGDVHSDLRLSTEPIHSDLISRGCADILLSMEPMEALRYMEWLSEDSTVVTSDRPFVNIDNYPSDEDLAKAMSALPHLVAKDIEQLAKDAGNLRGSNMVLLGMAAKFIQILEPEQIRSAVRSIFASKGEEIIEANLRCFDLGYESI